MIVMLRGQKVDFALEEEQWDRILLGYLTWGDRGRNKYLGRLTPAFKVFI